MIFEKLIKYFTSLDYYIVLSVIVIIFAVIVRLINLNYNTPFNDEAIYIVIGRLGVFHHDWTTYNPSSWMAGNPLIYPATSAIAYMSGGILSSRLINVIFGVLSVELVFRLTAMMSTINDNRKYLTGVIAAAILGGSAVSIYVSRLATYDAPSFYFLLMGVYFLIYSIKHQIDNGRYYFLAAVFVFMSAATKIITAVYLPLIAFTGYYYIFVTQKRRLEYYFKYFLIPLIMGLIFYSALNFSDLVTFFSTQVSQEYATALEILSFYWENIYLAAAFWIVGSLGMLIKGRLKEVILLNIAAALIVGTHIITHRLPTFDKHIFLSLVPISIISGLGIGEIVAPISKYAPKFKFAISLLVFMPLIVYWIFSYDQAQQFNNLWLNGDKMLTNLEQAILPGDKVLTEYGAATMLALYDKNAPTNITTFDYFNYHDMEGGAAYQKALNDAYFDYVEINNERGEKMENFQKVHQIVKDNLDNYHLVYEENGFLIYRRNY